MLFAGDSAHGVSPFGARGANSGVQDAENLAWKLAMVLEGKASDALLDTYASEREFAADENIRNSTRSTDFITPKSPVSRVFRDAVLKLARHHPFARQLTNSGRLSVPAVLRDSPLNTADSDSFDGLMVPGASCVDAPVHAAGQPAWLLQQLGQQFTGVLFCGEQGIDQTTQAALDALRSGPIPLKLVVVTSGDAQVAAASGAQGGARRRRSCRRALRRQTRHVLSDPPGPACLRALAATRRELGGKCVEASVVRGRHGLRQGKRSEAGTGQTKRQARTIRRTHRRQTQHIGKRK